MAETNRILDLSYRGLSADDLVALLATMDVTNPTEIQLEGNPIGDRGAESLANWSGLARVEVLNLANTELGLAGLKALLASPFHPQPIALHLDENPLCDEGICLLASSSFVSRVRYLGLSCTGLDHAGARALAESPHLTATETVSLTQTELLDESWQLLMERFPRIERT